MLLFRSEEHVRRWCRAWKCKPGAIFSLEKGWRLAQAWYADRLDPRCNPQPKPPCYAWMNPLLYSCVLLTLVLREM